MATAAARLFRLFINSIERESTELTSQVDIPTRPYGVGQQTEVRLRELFMAFSILGMSSFGGGLSGWIHRDLVEKRQWITMPDFLAGLSLARAMPGINAVNLAIWIGYQLRKGSGAFVAACGILAGPMVLIILCALMYHHWGQSQRAHQVLLGVTAAAIGLSLSLVFKSLRPAAANWFYALIIALLFIAIGILKWPMLPVVGVLGPASIAWAFLVEKPDEGQ